MDGIKIVAANAMAIEPFVNRIIAGKGAFMARSNESAIQRLQVGLVGLLVVLLFVSIASMILDGANDPIQAVTDGSDAKTGGAANAKAAGEEPLVELGVTPVVPEQPAKQAATPAAGTPQN
jgi:hypothetical protein